MNIKEKQYSTQIAQIMRAARKHRGISQIEISKVLGIQQGTLSKVERASLVISTPIWFEFCSYVKISPQSFLFNYIDDPLPESNVAATISDSETFFKLPKRYDFSKGSTVRGLRGIVNFAENAWGRTKFVEFLDQIKIDPDFFIVLTNKINIQFTFDLLHALKKSGNLEKDDFKRLTIPYSSPSFHGNLGASLERLRGDSDLLLKELFSNLERYQTNFDYTLCSNGAERILQGTPKSFLTEFNPAESIADGTCRMKTSFLEATLSISGHASTIMHPLCYFNGDPTCQYVISN